MQVLLMFINSFFKLKVYFLGGSWVRYGSSIKLLNRSIFVCIKRYCVIYSAVNEVALKRIFFVLRSLIYMSGVVSIISDYFCLFKSTRSSCFFLREVFLGSHSSGYFSNLRSYYTVVNLIPDIAIVFSLSNNLKALGELRSVGVPTIGVASNDVELSLIDYPLLLDSSVYFINFCLLRAYSRYISIIKHQ
jgi:hypothetical protein